MRHRVSLAAAAGFGLLALGSGEGEKSPVSITYDGPSSVVAGQGFRFDLRVQNGSDAPVIVSEVRVSGDARRSLGIEVPGATAQPYGDGVRYPVVPLTVGPGLDNAIAMQGTPYLRGWQSAKVELCDAGGKCHAGHVGTTVSGGAERAITHAWTTPSEVTAGQPFEIALELRNLGGGPDLVESIGMKSGTADWLGVTASDPPNQGAGDELAREVWRYDIGLEPGQTSTVRWTAVVANAGTHSGQLSLCLASETFCIDEDVTIVAK